MAQGGSRLAVEDARDIHARLCQGDPVASSELAIAYLDPLAAWLLRTNPRIDPHLCEEAAADAILSLIKNPRSFKPERASLGTYLKMSAQGDLRNTLEKEKRHRERRVDLDVDLLGSDRNLLVEDADPALIVEREESEREDILDTIATQAERSFTPEEQRVLALLAEGERSTTAYAQALGIADLPENEQRHEVKRVKDRIKRRMQRARGKT